MGYPVQRLNLTEPLAFLLVLTSDHITGATGKTPTVTISKNGGAFGTPIGAVTEIGNGWYRVAANATDANTLGPLLLHATAALCDPTDEQYDIVEYNPTSYQAVSVVAGAGPTASARSIIKRAFRLIGVLAQGESPSDAEEQDAFASLNEIVESWATQHLTMLSLSRTVYDDLVPDQAVYTIGESGVPSFSGIRPVRIEGAALLLDGDSVETSLRILTESEYYARSDKTLTGEYPSALYYQPTVPNGTITLLPAPTTTNHDLVLYIQAPVPRFANLTSTYAFGPGYLRALRYALAVDLAPEFGKPADPVLLQTAREALSQIKMPNVRIEELGMGLACGAPGAGYDILTDSW